MLRSLRTTAAKPDRHVLAVIADGSLNIAFLGVALRVAAAKLIAALDAARSPAALGVSAPVATPSATGGRIPAAEPLRAEPPRTSVTWSGGAVSSVASAGIEATDAASAAFLSACTTALATSLGPIARIFVRDAVRKVCSDRPFSRSDGPALLAQLSAMIESAQDRAAFQRATRAL